MRNFFLIGLVCVGAALVATVLWRVPLALAALHVGNEFFGGELPYNLTLADTSYQAALALDPQVPDAWHQRARISFLRGHFDEALSRINTQIALHGDTLMAAYYIRGLIHGYRKEFPQAEEDFARFVLWNPTNWAANNDLAWIYFAQGKFKEAEERSRAGLYKHPDNTWLLISHGMALYNLGKYKEAREDLEHAQKEAATLTEDDWRQAYPGNDPAIAAAGIEAVRKTIETDLALLVYK